MSVLIKGMKMPTSCPICVVIDAAGQARRYDLNNDRYADNELFQANYIPPHGRLIDADALEYHADNVRDPMGRAEKTVMWSKIQSAPTIIPAEEGE